MINQIAITKCEGFNMGVSKTDKGYVFSYASDNPRVKLLLFTADTKEPDYTIELDSDYKNGNVFSVLIKGISPEISFYLYEDGGFIVADPYARCLKYSVFEEREEAPYGVLNLAKFNWKEDKGPGYSRNELIMYKIHPKGWTANRFSKVRNKGTFRGIMEKIPYLLELGVNAVELMPAYEYIPEKKIEDFWGYDSGFYFTPKLNYCACKDKKLDYTVEFKEMVRELHSNGIEVIMEMFFPTHIPAKMILDCIRYWKQEYHIDGVHLLCDERVRFVLAGDEYIKDVKLFYANWYEDVKGQNLYEYNEGFLETARRLLKGDENQLMPFLSAIKKNPEHASNVNFIAYNNGFTLADLVSYDHKHNEANNEGNRDGVDFNISWNCGAEGPTNNRKIKELRQKLMRNAMTMVFLSQGVPLIYGGDEFGNSQNGNNNAYCQDNELGWVDWSTMKRNTKFFEFVKGLIAFRNNHKVLSLSKEPLLMDYKYYGLPDMSYHGSRAWYPETDHYNRHIGVMLCGRYAKEEKDIYIGYNLHWESHNLALPIIPQKEWKLAFSTDGQNESAIIDERTVNIAPRSIIVLINEKNS